MAHIEKVTLAFDAARRNVTATIKIKVTISDVGKRYKILGNITGASRHPYGLADNAFFYAAGTTTVTLASFDIRPLRMDEDGNVQKHFDITYTAYLLEEVSSKTSGTLHY